VGKPNKIARVVISFYNAKLNEQVQGGTGKFNITELRTVVQTVEPAKNDSVDRILRNLRQKNQVNYVVLDRNKSLYQVLPVGPG
jgi:hypothetical protein